LVDARDLGLRMMTKASEPRSEFVTFRKHEAGFSVRTRQDFEALDGSHADERITMPGNAIISLKCYTKPDKMLHFGVFTVL
jgi:hypothetical protein